MRHAIAAATLLALAGSAAAQTTRKVPQDFPSIEAAEAACNPGDTIKIAAGRYFENVTLNVADVTIVGSGVVWDGNIDGTDGPCLTIFSAGVTVQGITFRNGTNHVYSEGGNLKVSKCTFIDSDGTSVNIDAGTGNTVTGCAFRGAGTDGAHSDASDTVVTKCTMRSVSSSGIVLHAANSRAEGNTVTLLDGLGVTTIAASVVVSRNKVFNCSGQGIGVDSIGATVSGNTVQKTDGDYAIGILGANATVEKNRCVDNGGGVDVNGNGAIVRGNRVSDVHGGQAGYRIHADDMTVVGNTATLGSGGAYGYWLYSQSVTGGGVIEKNRASGFIDTGFYLGEFLYGATVTALTATNCGSQDDEGFWISGDDNVFTKLVASNIDNAGIRQDGGDNNVYIECSATNCDGNGFWIYGTDTTLQDCTTKNCGEGLDNLGTATIVTRGKYRGDRFDITNGGTFVDMNLVGVDFTSGGSAQPSEVD
jgi:hypothetical protein